MKIGLTFSNRYCRHLGLDWKKTYQDILDRGIFNTVRIPIYWDKIEPSSGEFNWENVDFIVNTTKKYTKIRILPVLGRKTPRWPEYHEPVWLENCTYQSRVDSFLQYFNKFIERYPNFKTIQIENEPLVDFGLAQIPISIKEFTDRVQAIRSLFKGEIITSDSIEWGNISRTLSIVDKVGINIYPRVYTSTKKVNHRSNIFRKYRRLAKRYQNRLFVAELQAEPWWTSHVKHLTSKNIRKTIKPVYIYKYYKKLTKHTDTLLYWGVEWWYYQLNSKDYNSRREGEEYIKQIEKVCNHNNKFDK